MIFYVNLMNKLELKINGIFGIYDLFRVFKIKWRSKFETGKNDSENDL